MFTFILIAKQEIPQTELCEYLAPCGEVQIESANSVIARRQSHGRINWMRVYREDRVLMDYEPEQRAQFDSLGDDPAFYIVEGNYGLGILANDFLNTLPQDSPYLIDNDHGLIAQINLFRARATEGVDWLHCSG